MGLRGPAPKRPEELVGNVSRARRDGDDQTTVSIGQTIVHKAKPPNGSSEWSDSAKLLYKAARNSAQSTLYEASDWAVLHSLMADLTSYQNNPVRNAQYLSSIQSVLNDLLMTEGSRRRRRVLLDKRDTPAKAPAGSTDWHKDAKRLYAAAKRGKQAEYYEPSDWAYLHFVMTEMTQHRETNSSGLMFATLHSMLADVLMTEGTRRQLDLDLGTADKAKSGPTEGDKEVQKWMVELTKVPTCATSTSKR